MLSALVRATLSRSLQAVSVRPGHIIHHNNKALEVLDFDKSSGAMRHVSIHLKLKDILTGALSSIKVPSDHNFEMGSVEKLNCEYLYKEGEDQFVLMDKKTFEQTHVPGSLFASQQKMLVEGMAITMHMHEGKPVSVALPQDYEYVVASTEETSQGRVQPGFKSATLTIGVRIQVPPFVNAGEKIRINLSTMAYVSRA
jgi:elongation factor P